MCGCVGVQCGCECICDVCVGCVYVQKVQTSGVARNVELGGHYI